MMRTIGSSCQGLSTFDRSRVHDLPPVWGMLTVSLRGVPIGRGWCPCWRLAVLGCGRAPFIYPNFESSHRRENEERQHHTQPRHPQTAQADRHADGGRHLQAGRRGQPLNVARVRQLENGPGTDKADAGGNPLNNARDVS
jgi:hypothetical protein